MNKKMKICIIGLGSIGCRHIINVAKIFTERNINFQIDALRSNRLNELTENIKCLLNAEYYSMDELSDDYDIIFITNPTYLHYDTLKRVKNKTSYVFLEKPVFEHCGYKIDEFINQRIYVACPLRYTPVIKYLKEKLMKEKIFSVRAISSSFLPEWRKAVDYRNVYSSKKSLGGGVTLDLIHEWDYLIYLFGFPEKVNRLSGKYSALEIDSEDLSIYIAEYQDKLIELHLDYFGRYTVRKLEIYCEKYVMEADILNQVITYKGQEEKKLILDKEDFYINEMNYFVDMVNKNLDNQNDILHAVKTLKVALEDEL